MDFPAGSPSQSPNRGPRGRARRAPLEVFGRQLPGGAGERPDGAGADAGYRRARPPGRPGVIVTASGDGGFDFVSRYFAPAKGMPEDPVTGGAHCMLAPYWATRLGKTAFRAFQASPRGGEIVCRLVGDRVELEGKLRLLSRRRSGDLSARRRITCARCARTARSCGARLRARRLRRSAAWCRCGSRAACPRAGTARTARRPPSARPRTPARRR